MHRRITLLLLLALAGCGAGPSTRVSGCVAQEPLVPLCGFQHPEDIELLPDGHTLVISEMGDMDGSTGGSLALYDTASGIITRLPRLASVSMPSWGSEACNEPAGPALSPHGIDLLRREDGALELFVVNHGGRESIELFELSPATGGWQITWRGCVLPPEGTWMNDVAALPDASFLVSHMFPRHGPEIGGISLYMVKAMFGFDTGYVLHCDRTGCTHVEGSDAPFPNGVQVDAGGKTLFLNAYMAGEVRRIDLASGKLLGAARIKAPDNAQWDATGRLLVASQTGSMSEMRACFGIIEGACGAAFEIIAVDPSSMQTEVLLSHEGPPMGAATVAQQVGDALYIGSFSGDRMLRSPMPPASR